MTLSRIIAFAAAASAAWAVPASAQDSATMQDEVVVTAGSAENASGRVAVNIVAGSGNQQAGAAAIANGEAALVGLSLDQVMDSPVGGDRATSIAIQSRAFAGLEGMASINVTAGQGNQSANLAALAIGTGALTDMALSQSRAPTGSSEVLGTDLNPGNDTLNIADDAFLGGSGLLQVNLVGGERNSSANTFALSVSGSGQ